MENKNLFVLPTDEPSRLLTHTRGVKSLFEQFKKK
jgi:hypothetical protein